MKLWRQWGCFGEGLWINSRPTKGETPMQGRAAVHRGALLHASADSRSPEHPARKPALAIVPRAQEAGADHMGGTRQMEQPFSSPTVLPVAETHRKRPFLPNFHHRNADPRAHANASAHPYLRNVGAGRRDRCRFHDERGSSSRRFRDCRQPRNAGRKVLRWGKADMADRGRLGR